MDTTELRFADGRVATVPFGLLVDAWLAWAGGEWNLDPLTTAAVALSRPTGIDRDVVIGLRAACRSRLGLDQ